MEVDLDGSLSYPEPQVDSVDNADKHSRPKSLSVDEELFMRVYYEYKLREVCSAFYFPHKIQEFCQATHDQIQMLKDTQAPAVGEVDKITFTDVPLMYPPGQLALCVVNCK